MITGSVNEEVEECSVESEPKVVSGVWLVGPVEKREGLPGQRAEPSRGLDKEILWRRTSRTVRRR